MSSKAVQSKCIQNVLTNDRYCKWSAAEPMLHAVKKLSISLSCPAAKTRITDLVSGKVQQVQRPRWHHMAPSSGGVLTELGAFILWLIDLCWCGWWMVTDDHQDPQVSAKLLTKALKYPRALKQNVGLKDLLSLLSNLGRNSGAPWPRSQRRSRWCGCVSNRDLRLPWDCGSGWIWCGRMIWSA